MIELLNEGTWKITKEDNTITQIAPLVPFLI